jgi:hypothetical protein
LEIQGFIKDKIGLLSVYTNKRNLQLAAQIYNEEESIMQSTSTVSMFAFTSETAFLNFSGALESILPAYVTWQAGTTILFLLVSEPP